jgi:hypothetical protein
MSIAIERPLKELKARGAKYAVLTPLNSEYGNLSAEQFERKNKGQRAPRSITTTLCPLAPPCYTASHLVGNTQHMRGSNRTFGTVNGIVTARSPHKPNIPTYDLYVGCRFGTYTPGRYTPSLAGMNFQPICPQG